MRGIDMEIGKGEIVALLGANGAGKSSTMNAVAGLVPVASARCCSTGATSPTCRPRRSRSRG
ncbi:MAG: ATP-binding cassette domain-containing protein [Paracoccaceae bacterium]